MAAVEDFRGEPGKVTKVAKLAPGVTLAGLPVDIWNSRLAGATVETYPDGRNGELASLCGYRADGAGRITHAIVAYSPERRCELPAGEVVYLARLGHFAGLFGATPRI